MASEFRELVLGEEFMDFLRDPEPAPARAKADVEALGESLEANLRAQLGLYREYVETANRQRLAMINGGARGADINVESEQLLTALASLEADRIALVEGILAAGPGLGRRCRQGQVRAPLSLLQPGAGPAHQGRPRLPAGDAWRS